MNEITIAKNGRVACGSCFTSCQGSQTPGSISLLGGGGSDGASLSPDLTAFSSFGVTRSAHSVGKAGYEAGGHVTLVYNNGPSFLAAAVVRCDTWAVQWAIERAGCLANATVTDLAMLCANTVCGVASSIDSASSSHRQCIFVATRFDVLVSSRKENKEWRQFLACPRTIETGLEAEGIAAVAALDRNTLAVLSLKGTLALVRLNVNKLKAQQKPDTPFYSVERADQQLRDVSSNARIVVYNDEGECVCGAVYSSGDKAVTLVQFDDKATDGAGLVTKVQRVSVDVPVRHLCFVGPFHLCICGDAAKANLQFVSLVPGSDSTEVMTFNPLTSPHPPLGVYYDQASEQAVLLSSSLSPAQFASSGAEQRSKAIIEASLSFASGPFSQGVLSGASWSAVSNPYRHYGPQSDRFGGKGSDEEGDEDVQVLQKAAGNGAGRWTPLTLCYALATKRGSEKVCIALFSVETAPHLHTRLIKQWHNATAGLQTVLKSVSTRSYAALGLSWNPRHVRRALRLLSQEELSSLFHCIATAISASERLSSSVAYYDATTAAVDVGLHVITLARQVGAVLRHDDIRAIAIILRAARECGHELLRYASRMELLMESCLQQRALNRVLGRRASSAAGDEEPAEQSLETSFYGISAELQTECTLHTRYSSNAWAQHLATHAETSRKEAAAASQLLALVLNGNEKSTNRVLSDWKAAGAAPHQDPLLNRFEQTLL